MLCALVAVGALRQLDRALLDLVQSVDSPWLNLFGSVVGIFGQAEVTAGVALGLAVARLRRGRSDAWVPLLIAAVVAVEISPTWAAFSFFIVLITFLLARPQGMFGVRERTL